MTWSHVLALTRPQYHSDLGMSHGREFLGKLPQIVVGDTLQSRSR
jgi:hypothetical protein